MNFLLLSLFLFFVKEASALERVLAFDVGSSGTRVFAVQFDDKNNIYSFKQWTTPNHPNEFYNKSKFDLDSLILKSESEKQAACQMLVQNLLTDYMDLYIPVEERPSIPLLVYSTAGMRLLSKKDQDYLNKYLYEYLKKNTKYSISQDDVITLEGWRESLYQWIAVNVIFEAINSGVITVPILSIGGGSAQFTLELKEKPKDKFLQGFVYEVDLNDKPHYIFLHSFLHFGTDTTANMVHQPLYDAHDFNTPCEYDNGKYTVEIITNKETDKREWIDFNGTANFTKCFDMVSDVYKKPDPSKCHGFSGIFSEFQADNCIPNPEPFDLLYGMSIVQDAVTYIKPDLDNGVTIGTFLEKSKEYAKNNISKVLADNGGDDNAIWTLSNQAMTLNFLLRGFSDNKNINDVKLYTNYYYKSQYIAWGLGAVIGRFSNGFKMVPVNQGLETWKIITISVVCVVVVVVAAVIAIVCVLRRRKKLQEKMIDEDDV